MKYFLKRTCMVSTLIHEVLYGGIMWLSYKNSLAAISRQTTYEWETWSPLMPIKVIGLAMIVGIITGLIIGSIAYVCSGEVYVDSSLRKAA